MMFATLEDGDVTLGGFVPALSILASLFACLLCMPRDCG